MAQEYGYLLQGKEKTTGDILVVENPYDGSLVADVHRADGRAIEEAIAAAEHGFAATRSLPSYKRTQILSQVSQSIANNAEDLTRTIALEAGKPLSAARTEVDRCRFTFHLAAGEAERITGELLPLDLQSHSTNRWGLVRRFPIGPITAITPFNFPLNLVAHKVAPAMSAGNPILVRPSSNTPLSALKLGRLILEAGWPEEGIAVLPSTTEVAESLVTDERIKMLTFTGSPPVGWALKARAGRKRVTLELGGNAGVIVHSDADLDYAAQRCVVGGFSYAGQSCISVQRIYLQENIYEEFLDGFVEKVKKLKVGDPLDESTDVGPLIDQAAADRIGSWLDEALQGGAEVLMGGTLQGNMMQPTVIADVRPEMKVSCQEVFAPVVTVTPYHDFVDAARLVNDSEYGLQAGVFTRDLSRIFQAYEAIEVGGLIVNDVPTYRVDHMPYGGVKMSGLGREGVRYAIQEMTEPRLLVLNLT
ncbi:MAG: aldehyde dehydrogenase family protein [Chloroflexi bacterium]|nr:aldehyde dehydrogenase family protein [Chloroflexota bacterium]